MSDTPMTPEQAKAMFAAVDNAQMAREEQVLRAAQGASSESPMTPDAAMARLQQYREEKTLRIATYESGTERALHEIGTALAAEVARLNRLANMYREHVDHYRAAANKVQWALNDAGKDTSARGESTHAVAPPAPDPRPACESDTAEPEPLRWGLDDLEQGDDDSVTLWLSGLAGEPYVLELDADRAAALRCGLGGPNDEGMSGPCDCGEGAVHYTSADCPAEQRVAKRGEDRARHKARFATKRMAEAEATRCRRLGMTPPAEVGESS